MFKMRCWIPNDYILDITMYKMHVSLRSYCTVRIFVSKTLAGTHEGGYTYVFEMCCYRTNGVQCVFLSNATLFCLMVELYLHLLPKVQLHVSALDTIHLQVVHEYLETSYTRFNMGCVRWGCGGHEISYVSWRLGVGYMG